MLIFNCSPQKDFNQLLYRMMVIRYSVDICKVVFHTTACSCQRILITSIAVRLGRLKWVLLSFFGPMLPIMPWREFERYGSIKTGAIYLIFDVNATFRRHEIPQLQYSPMCVSVQALLCLSDSPKCLRSVFHPHAGRGPTSSCMAVFVSPNGGALYLARFCHTRSIVMAIMA